MSQEAAEAEKKLPAKTVIIGARGRMGGMLMRCCAKAGLTVAALDLPYDEKEMDLAFQGADLVLVCVPARHFAEVLRKITPHMAPETILADITSVKEIPMRQMNSAWSGPVVGTHPLFGPKTESNLRVALVAGKGATKASMGLVSSFFEALGCLPFETSAEKHDKAMARIQNMNFITNLAYFAALAGQKDLLPFLTPSFERRRQAAAKMLNEDAEMFAGLFEANPHSHEAVRQYRRMLNLAASGDIELLCARARWWWENQQANEAASKNSGENN